MSGGTRRWSSRPTPTPSIGHVPPFVSGAPVVELGSIGFPGYPDVRLVVGKKWRTERTLATFAPDVVHLASPFILGWRGILAAERLGLPSVAVYQTEVPGYAAATAWAASSRCSGSGSRTSTSARR